MGHGSDNPFPQRVRVFDNRALVITQDYSVEREAGVPVSIQTQIYSRNGDELGLVKDEMQALEYFSDSLFILSDYLYENQRETCSVYSQDGSFMNDLPGYKYFKYLTEKDGLFLCNIDGNLTALNKQVEVLWSLPRFIARNISVSADKQIVFRKGQQIVVLDSLGHEMLTLDVSDKEGGALAVISDDGCYLFWASYEAINHSKKQGEERLKRPGKIGLFDVMGKQQLWVKKLADVTFSFDTECMGFIGSKELLFARNYKSGLHIYNWNGDQIQFEPMNGQSEDILMPLQEQLLLYDRFSGMIRLIKQSVN